MVTREFPPYAVGGVGTHTLHLSRALQNAGVDVQAISFGDPRASSNAVRFVAPKSSIISRSPQSTGHDLAVMCDIARYGRILNRIVAKEDFDIVHVQEPYVGGYLKARNKVTTIHDTSYGELRSMASNATGLREIKKVLFYMGLGFAAEYASIASSKAIITPAPNIAHELVKKYRLGGGKVRTIMNGVEAETLHSSISKEEAKDRLQIDSSKVLVFTSARHIARKRLDLLLMAISHLDSNDLLNGLEVRIGGDGPLKPRLEHLAQKLGIASKVKFLGWMSEDVLSLHHRASDVFVICSDYEASPIAILEAMMNETAVVSTRIPGFPAPSLAENGVDLLLVPPRNHAALAAAIQLLVVDKGARERISKNAKTFALQYTWDKVARRTLAVYEACLR